MPTIPAHPWLTLENQSDWLEFCQWMNKFDSPEHIVYCALAWDGSTFVLTPELASEKVQERFNTWKLHRRARVEAIRNFTIVPKAKRTKPEFNLNLKDLIK